jgi:hypothetical protein
MSIQIYVHNETYDRPASIEEIEALFLNCYSDGSGMADIDSKRPNGVAVEPSSLGLRVEVVKE